jgi:hypothetical protein
MDILWMSVGATAMSGAALTFMALVWQVTSDGPAPRALGYSIVFSLLVGLTTFAFMTGSHWVVS